MCDTLFAKDSRHDKHNAQPAYRICFDRISEVCQMKREDINLLDSQWTKALLFFK